MKPLQAVAMGMVVILLVVQAGEVDLLANPLGWVLVIVGVRQLPAAVDLRPTLLVLSGLALLVSLPLCVPSVVDALDDADESLAWALNLPQFGTYLLLSLALSRAAVEHGDRAAGAWWSTMVLGFAAVLVLPVLIFGGGLDGLEALAGLLVGLVPTVTIVLLFVHSSRAWAGAPAVAAPPATEAG